MTCTIILCIKAHYVFSTKFVFIGLASQHFYCWMLGCYMCNGLEYVPIVPTPHALQLLLCACKITHMLTTLILTTDEFYGMPLKKNYAAIQNALQMYVHIWGSFWESFSQNGRLLQKYLPRTGRLLQKASCEESCMGW